jgi:outer membrane protein assembly factor BamB
MIDLGVLVPGSEDAHLLRRRAIRRGSRLGIVLLVVALGLMLSGELGPASAKLRVVGSLPFAPGAQYVVDGDKAFVAEVGPRGSRISRYDLPTGRLRWSTAVASLSSLVNLQSGEGVLVATRYALGQDGDRTVALDEASGRVLWRNRYSTDTLLPGGRVLLAHSSAVDTGTVAEQGAMPSGQPAAGVDAVDLRSGRLVWTYALDAGCQHAATGRPGPVARLAVLCPAGDLRVVDLATGRVLRSTRVPPQSVLSTAGQRLVLGSDRDGSTRVTAYDTGTLRPLWTVTATGVAYGTYPCAQLLCLSDARGLTVLDPDTGEERWHTPEHVAVEVPGAGAVRQLPSALAGDLLVQPLGAASAGMVAAGSGRPLLYLDRWQSITGATRVPLFARWPDIPDGRVWFGVLSGQPVALNTVGFAPDVLKGQCRFSGEYLICETLAESLRVWRYRP